MNTSPEFQFDVFASSADRRRHQDSSAIVLSLRDRLSFLDAATTNAVAAAAASVTATVPAAASRSAHSRSLSAPVFERGSGCWGEPFQYTEVFTPDKTKGGWSYLLKRSDGDVRISQRASLEKDVHELRLQLEIEKSVRKVLEKAITSPCEPLSYGILSPRTAELIKEISSLESEVVHLEKHVLALYRKVHDNTTPAAVASPKRLQQSLSSSSSLTTIASEHNVQQHRPRKAHSFQHRRHTSQGCQSLQDAISCGHSKTRHGSLLGGGFGIAEEPENETRVFSPEFHVPGPRDWSLACDAQTPAGSERKTAELYETPTKLSERMVRCMAAIYCKLADPPLVLSGDALSPPSSSSTTPSSNGTSSHDVSSDGWSPVSKDSAACSTEVQQQSMIEVPWIRVDKERLTYAAQALRSFRSMVEHLEKVRPGEMKHDEKLAFWINIYNALVMHAYLAYGIPRSHLKRISLLQKAAYKVGSYSINAYTIENSILGCRSQRPAQWLQTLFGPLTKFKSGERRAYALNTPEPLVCFALCSGGRSDPAVRVYSPKSVKTELESAKRDFLVGNVSTKNSKVLAPKLLESYARDAGLSSGKLLDWIIHNTSDRQARNSRHGGGKSTSTTGRQQRARHLEWVPYDFDFRYVFARELAAAAAR